VLKILFNIIQIVCEMSITWKPDGFIGEDAKDLGIACKCVHKGLKSRRKVAFDNALVIRKF